MLSVLLAIFLPLATSFAAEAPVFVLSCNSYPDVCDTHCFALACATGTGATNFRDVNRYLHYAADSGSNKPDPNHSTTEATYRRRAIGCGNSNCARDFPGTQCDEFPYASTFDGGLGCMTTRYPGTDAIALSGVNHCASGDQNGRHGNHLKAFYASQNLGNGDRFQIAFDEANVDHAVGCKMIRAGGTGVCGRVRAATGQYNVPIRNGRPNGATCPGIGRRRRATLGSGDDNYIATDGATFEQPWDGYVNTTWTRSVDAHGNVVLFPFRDDAPPAMTRVFRVKRDGSELQSHIVG